MARHQGAVLIEANVIIEAHRVRAWRALAGGYQLVTVARGCMVGELATALKSDGLAGVGEGLRHELDGVADGAFGLALDAAAFQEALLVLHQRDAGAEMIGTGDGVAFPVAKGLTGLDDRGALVDVDAVGDQMGGTATYA